MSPAKPLPEALKTHIEELKTKLMRHPSYNKDVWKCEREVLWTLISSSIPKTRCKACGGIGHGVQHKCSSNKVVSSILKNTGGPFKSMWAAVKNADTNKGKRKNALSKLKSKEIARANVMTKAASIVSLGEKRPAKDIDDLIAEINDPDLNAETLTTKLKRLSSAK